VLGAGRRLISVDSLLTTHVSYLFVSVAAFYIFATHFLICQKAV
jgi:hypothetical protein